MFYTPCAPPLPWPEARLLQIRQQAAQERTKEKSGYKKIKNVSAKKRSITVTKVNKKKIKKNHKYYFKVVALSKSGKKTLKSSVYYIDGVSVY